MHPWLNINESTCLWKFVVHKFYVDDGLTSVPTAQEALSLLKRTQTALKKEGNLRLHKIASNDPEVFNSFEKEDFCKKILSLNLDRMISQFIKVWDLESESFIFNIQVVKNLVQKGLLVNA